MNPDTLRRKPQEQLDAARRLSYNDPRVAAKKFSMIESAHRQARKGGVVLDSYKAA